MAQLKKTDVWQCDCGESNACWETARVSGLWTRNFPIAAVLKSIG